MTSPQPDWAALEQLPAFRGLLRAKRVFIVPATIFFVAYYFALPTLVGYWPELMSTRVIGPINIAYLFALSQFVMAWTLMALYIRRARRFDEVSEQIVRRVGEPGEPS
jgi:uncharacterized membrane protein (DUF485 family)